MHSQRILKHFNLTRDRLKDIFTAESGTPDGEIRKRIEERIQARINDGVCTCARNSDLFTAIDLAWDIPPIGKEMLPLMLFAQSKIKPAALAQKLKGTPVGEALIVKKDENTLEVELPRLHEMHVSILRSYVTRRLASQTERFANLWPYFRYEPRGTDTVTKCKADVLSQRVDVMVEQYNMRHFGTQCMRDMLLYSRSVTFPRSAWDKQIGWREKNINAGSEVELESYTLREGVDFTNPNPSKIFWDTSAPLANINTDNGPEFIGYWDIIPYRNFSNNPDYYNRQQVYASDWFTTLIEQQAQFFNYYFDAKIIDGIKGKTLSPAAANDRKLMSTYAANEGDVGVLHVQYFERINPKREGICDYDCNIWLRYTVAGDGTIMHAEPMASSPAAYGGINEKDDRYINASMAMELMSYQDQLNNLCTQMLAKIRESLIQVWLIDKDSLDPEVCEYVKKGIKKKDFFVEPHAWVYSSSALRDNNIQDPEKAFKVISADMNAAVESCFNAMNRLIGLADRLLNMSPNEIGQPAQREISAREVQEISATTSSMSTFISDGIDEQRAAMKRIIYESLVCMSEDDFTVPALSRYTQSTLDAAGFKVKRGDAPNIIPLGTPIVGSPRALIYEYIYDSRDGAERTPNTSVSKTIVQVLQYLTSLPDVAKAMGKRRLFDMINEAIRLSGAGLDLVLELDEGEDDGIGDHEIEARVAQLEQIIAQIQQRSSAAPESQAVTAPPENAGELLTT